MNLYAVHKWDGTTVVVTILRHKNKAKYSFVNLTKGHICPCEFDSIEDAIRDMDDRVNKGFISSYLQIK